MDGEKKVTFDQYLRMRDRNTDYARALARTNLAIRCWEKAGGKVWYLPLMWMLDNHIVQAFYKRSGIDVQPAALEVLARVTRRANAIKAGVDAFGAGSDIAESLDNTAKLYQDLQSPERQAQRQRQAQRTQAAEQTNSAWEEIKAASKAVT